MDANKDRTFVSIRGCFSSPLVAALPRCVLLRLFIESWFSISVPTLPAPVQARLDRRMVIWFYGFMKTTLEIPDELFREMKAAAALRGIKLKDFVTSAIADQLARSKSAESAWSKERLPPPPKVTKTELKRIHKLIERESERVDPEDWQQ